MKLRDAALCAALGLSGTIAYAHSWYDYDCCSDQDCSPIPFGSVEIVEDGYRITLKPGDHPLVHAPFTYTIPYDSPNVRVSRDDKYHACVISIGEIPEATGPTLSVRCLYIGGLA